MAKIFDKIRKWSDDRNITKGATKHAQGIKFFEEASEVASGIARNDVERVKDGIGDCVVVLTIIAAQYGLTIEECIDYAYNEIKDRKGKMVDGVWVKEADLKPKPKENKCTRRMLEEVMRLYPYE